LSLFRVWAIFFQTETLPKFQIHQSEEEKCKLDIEPSQSVRNADKIGWHFTPTFFYFNPPKKDVGKKKGVGQRTFIKP
jgi:hypothetical protein